MFYIYDILLNFNDGVPYEFFEWMEEDVIDHIKKAPLYKVNRKTLQDLLYGKVTVSSSFLEEIFNRSEVYRKGMIDRIPYLSLFTDGTVALGVEFNEKGENVFRSRLLLDEEEEILEFAYDLKEIPLSYNGKCKLPSTFYTRNEKQIYHFLKQEFQTALEEDNLEKLRYFYEECFDEQIEDEKIVKEKLLGSLRHLSEAHKKLYVLLKHSLECRK